MPKKATPIISTSTAHVRLTPEILERIDELCMKGVAVSRSDFIKDAIMFKIYVEEHRVATFTLTQKDPIRSQDDRNTS